MKLGPVTVLKSTIIFIGLVVIGVCTYVLPTLIASELSGDFDYGIIFVGLYIPAIPFFIALYQAMKLLKYIDNNNAFSIASVNALKSIKYCAMLISIIFTVSMPYIFYVADRDDAPGVAALGFIIIASSFVIATFGAVAQKLFQNAVDIKSENDLTV